MRIWWKNRRILQKEEWSWKTEESNQHQNQKPDSLPHQRRKIAQNLPEEEINQNQPSQRHPPRQIFTNRVYCQNRVQKQIAGRFQQRHSLHQTGLHQIGRPHRVTLKGNCGYLQKGDEFEEKTNKIDRTGLKGIIDHRDQTQRLRRKTALEVRQHFRDGQIKGTRAQRPTHRDAWSLQKRREGGQQTRTFLFIFRSSKQRSSCSKKNENFFRRNETIRKWLTTSLSWESTRTNWRKSWILPTSSCLYWCVEYRKIMMFLRRTSWTRRGRTWRIWLNS